MDTRAPMGARMRPIVVESGVVDSVTCVIMVFESAPIRSFVSYVRALRVET